MSTLVEAEQRSPEWFKARLGVPTASDFDKVMAANETATYRNYVAEKAAERLADKPYSELAGRNFTTWEMQWGTDNEPVARLQYMLASGNEVVETGLWLHDELAAGASPDGFVNNDGTLEIKCPNTATHIETMRKGEVPYQYKWQVQGQLWITGRKWCDFVSFDPRLPENAQMIVITVDRDDAMIVRLENGVRDFLKDVESTVEFIKKFE